MKEILCLSTSNYYPTPTRKQNIMNRLSDCKVVYVNPPVTLAAPFKDPAARSLATEYRLGSQNCKEYSHIKIYFQPPVLPLYNMRRGINEINQKRLAKYLAKIVKENNFGDDFVVWCYSPMYADLIAPLATQLGIAPAKLWSRTVYDCVDRHSAYPGLIDPEVVDGMEEDLARSAHVVFATAEGLYERLRKFNDNTHLVPNGANYELFAKVAELTPDEGHTTTFGFVGAFQKCTDFDFIRTVANAYPDAKIQMVGKPLPGVDTSWVAGYRNIEIHKPVPQNELPELMKNFDVCLNCFADNDLSKDVSPLKFYEYLATGIPVVSTPVPLQVREFDDIIYIAENKDDVVEACNKALDEGSDNPKRKQRMKAGKFCSWDARVKEIRSLIDL